MESEELKFINFPKGAVFNKLSIEGAKITGIDGAIKVADCDIRDCTGLTELSIEASRLAQIVERSCKMLHLPTSTLLNFL